MKNSEAIDIEEFSDYEQHQLIEQILQTLRNSFDTRECPGTVLRAWLIDEEGFKLKSAEINYKRGTARDALEYILRENQCFLCIKYVDYLFEIDIPICYRSIIYKGNIVFRYITEYRHNSNVEKWGDVVSYEFYYEHMKDQLIEEVNMLAAYLMAKYNLNNRESLLKIIEIINDSERVKYL